MRVYGSGRYASRAPGSRGFSLLELLTVIAIIALLSGLVGLAMNNMAEGPRMTQAALTVMSELNQARQLAITRNRPVEVRLYSYADPGIPGSKAEVRSIQSALLLEDGTLRFQDRLSRLPANIVVSSSNRLSSLFTSDLSARKPGPADVQAGLPNGYEYAAFQFRPDGSTNLIHYQSSDSTNNRLWYLTLHDAKEDTSGGPPRNYATIQIDPVSGSTRLHRP